MASAVVEETRVRVAVVGCDGHGKTALVTRLCNATFSRSRTPTIGVDYQNKMYDADDDGVSVNAIFSDCSGQERFGSVRNSHIVTSDVVLLVLDLSSEHGVSYHVLASDIRKLAVTSPIVLVGTHADLLPLDTDSRKRAIVSCLTHHGITERTQALMHAAELFAVSNKTGDGFDELEQALCDIYTTRMQYHHALVEVAHVEARTQLARADDGSATGTAPQRHNDHTLVSAVRTNECDVPLTMARGALAASDARSIMRTLMSGK